ncbi:restriction endonuclease [Deinococcus rubellus]|uniref:Restriction endonuclease n=1 Tax=Deinococcus rubellus TaxID=1889240 RepID=A0ABY5YIJ8_9DEIO|nr:restriction endonuclease [Deinococcus rubellus]UWX64501.1 restriction endonuclease [Deinococcus rubellus]
MNVPKYHEFFNPLLAAMHQLGGSASLVELDEEAVRQMQLPSEVTDVLHGDTGKTEVQYRLAWARTYLKKYGLITNSSRGVWALTAAGQTTRTVQSRKVQGAVRVQRQQAPTDTTSNEEVLDDSVSIDEQPKWEDHLRETVLALTPGGFERLCQRILRESGFIQVEVTGRSGDGGIDGHGIVRLAGLLSFPIIFQAKKYRGSVGAPEIRNFRGAMVGRADKGLFITTGNFTPAASAEATRDGAPPIDLIDGSALVTKLKELKLGVSTRMVEVTEVDEDWFNSL